MRLRPEWYITGITPRCDLGTIQLYETCLCRLADYPRNGFRSLFGQLKSLAEGLVRHPLVHDVAKAIVLVTSTNSIAPIHVLKALVGEQHYRCPALPDPEIRRW